MKQTMQQTMQQPVQKSMFEEDHDKAMDVHWLAYHVADLNGLGDSLRAAREHGGAWGQERAGYLWSRIQKICNVVAWRPYTFGPVLLGWPIPEAYPEDGFGPAVLLWDAEQCDASQAEHWLAMRAPAIRRMLAQTGFFERPHNLDRRQKAARMAPYLGLLRSKKASMACDMASAS